ncbi:TRAP transporter small permease [Alkalicoccus luteus]|uniref:TRAP transporter small permease n=1 Tax=Alkalicoccus luteus TaxID=1237094 RepID=UPI0040342CFB
MKKSILKVKRGMDKSLLVLSLLMLLLTVLVILYQVFSRQVLGTSPAWTEALSRVLFVWVGFLGIAYGFKAKLHIGVSIFVKQLPVSWQNGLEFFSKLLVITLGGILLYYGTTYTVLMWNSNIAGLGIPSSFLYAVLPITGFYVLLNGIELLFTKGMHQEYGMDEGRA